LFVRTRWRATVLDDNAQEWFEALARRYAPALHQHALWIVRDPHVAEDIVQETLLRLWTASAAQAAPAKNETATRNWLYRVAGNLAIDHVRRERRRARLLIWVEPPPDPLTAMAENSTDPALLDALRRLSARERRVVHLVCVVDLDHAAVAEAMGVSEGNARVILHRALTKLRALLSPLEVSCDAG
jgi:RNA polymerase sigma-70 factor (ECF subfamily)